ncbi:cysteine hydrolase family protein [Serpentinicella alkaliphila]|uniref:Nicotinamidase-related amidase n=1 Tax=Serpentinicella alkaliphila TaxID=1734049 RepID=A0A4R2T356_9FIRM|nr:cysteine hydrolase family protein [Serpentinicella alkaliphila]QUH26429.1 cysteine hydrolase [Serpentinicella alkaliphila]TCP95264.1 nicotinamidase-related amidase [Serpentinicella alkaliphila]
MSKVVLLVVDVQNELINRQPYNVLSVIDNIKKLISTARNSKKEVIYVRHDGGNGSVLEKDSEGWQIFNDVSPIDGELIIEKRYNSAFLKTELKAYLESKGIHSIILVGLQTEYCIDATCKSAFDTGYKIIIPEETNTTFDNEFLSGNKLYEFFNYKIWNKRFASVLPIQEVIEILNNY